MPNNVLNSNQYHSKSATILVNATHWVAEIVEHHHQHKVQMLHVIHLRNLDHHILADMGIDEKALFESHPHIESLKKPDEQSR
jgi:hypothetical protein